MICLRCGHCCKWYWVSIVDDPERGIEEDNILVHQGDGVYCKHLRGDRPGQHSCAVHDRSWYKDTPCFTHSQVESKNSPCRIGGFVMKKEEKERA